MYERRPGALGSPGQRANRERIVPERLDRMVLRGVDLVVRRAVDNRVGPGQRDRASDCPFVGDVDLVARERHDVVPTGRSRDIVNTGRAHLPAGA